jgi:hypothetical protein
VTIRRAVAGRLTAILLVLVALGATATPTVATAAQVR